MAKSDHSGDAGTPRSRRSRRLAWVSFAVVSLVVAALVAYEMAPRYLVLRSASMLIVERVEPVGHPLELNESETTVQAPALAQLLDEARQDGRASLFGRENYSPLLVYLDEEAKEAGGSSLFAGPFNGTVEWHGAHFEIFRLSN